MKKNKPEVTNRMVFNFLYALALRKGIFFFTRFYPFSLTYHDSIYHYKNRRAKEFEDILRNNLLKLKFKQPMFAVELPSSPPIINCYLFFFKDSYEDVLKKKETLINSIAKDLKVSVNQMYLNVTQKQETWKLQMPYEYLFES